MLSEEQNIEKPKTSRSEEKACCTGRKKNKDCADSHKTAVTEETNTSE